MFEIFKGFFYQFKRDIIVSDDAAEFLKGVEEVNILFFGNILISVSHVCKTAQCEIEERQIFIFLLGG